MTTSNFTDANSYLLHLKSASQQNRFGAEMEELAKKVKANDKTAWSVLYQAMRDVDSGKLFWTLHKELLTGIVKVLSDAGDSQAYRILINYIKSLDRTIPIGIMEYLSDVIPTFEQLDLDEIIELAENKNELKSAMGIMMISKLVLENKFSKEQTQKILQILNEHKNSKYFLEDIIESTVHTIEDHEQGFNMLSAFD